MLLGLRQGPILSYNPREKVSTWGELHIHHGFLQRDTAQEKSRIHIWTREWRSEFREVIAPWIWEGCYQRRGCCREKKPYNFVQKFLSSHWETFVLYVHKEKLWNFWWRRAAGRLTGEQSFQRLCSVWEMLKLLLN